MNEDQLETEITDYFGDLRRSPEETLEGLKGLRDHINLLIESLEEQLKD